MLEFHRASKGYLARLQPDKNMHTVSADVYSWVRVYAKTARTDVKAARVLHSQRLYPQACFFLQQSVEKASKAFGLLLGTITIDELRTHSSLKSVVLHLPEAIEEVLEEANESAEGFPNIPRQSKAEYRSGSVLARLPAGLMNGMQAELKQRTSTLRRLKKRLEAIMGKGRWPRKDSDYWARKWRATLYS